MRLLPARIISYLFHPAIMPTMSLILLFNADVYLKYSVPEQMQKFLVLIVFLNTYLFPAIIVLIMRLRKVIPSIHLFNRKDRLYPFAIGCFFYLLTYLLVKKIMVPPLIQSLVFGSALSVFLTFFATLKYKVSVHMAGISGVLGLFFSVQLLFGGALSKWVVLLVLIWGAIGYARLKLKAHTNRELVLGSLIGFSAVAASVFMGWG